MKPTIMKKHMKVQKHCSDVIGKTILLYLPFGIGLRLPEKEYWALYSSTPYLQLRVAQLIPKT
jgi:hypothetical protein